MATHVEAWRRGQFDAACRAALDVLGDVTDESLAGRIPVVRRDPVGTVGDALHLSEWITTGGMSTETLRVFLRDFLDRSVHLHHPGSLAHQVAVPDLGSIVADLVIGAANNPGAVYEMGPAAIATELAVIDWMLTKVGWSSAHNGQNSAAGVFTHGGSLANLTALLGARAFAAPGAWADGVTDRLAVLAAPSAHYSIRRAAAVIGLGERSVVPLPVTDSEVIDPGGLPEAVETATRSGRRVMAVVASACATGTGLHDPLDAIGQFCQDRGLWLHVDAAHGGSALLSPVERRLLHGIHRANSIVWDAHKLLRTSGLCTAVLFRDRETFGQALQQEASYLFYEDDPDYPDLNRRTVECTKTAMALKVFLNLAIRGERGLARYVEAQYGLARRIHDLIAARPGFECLCRPESNIVCFRYGTDNARQVAIRESLLRAGRFHITSAEVRGVRWLRLTVMNPATTLATLDALLDEIVEMEENSP